MWDVIIVGSGPYGLAAVAYLRATGVNAKIFGTPMSFWKRHTPRGMLLRSSRRASDIGSPDPKHSLELYLSGHDVGGNQPIDVNLFIEYGLWFQEQVAPDIDRRLVCRIVPAHDHLRVIVDDGEALAARRVVVATGIQKFAYFPHPFSDSSSPLISHSSDPLDMERFGGHRVLVVGGGQSAIEIAALLNECGAEVEVVVRDRRIRWLHNRVALRDRMGPMGKLLFPWTDVGAPPLNQVVAYPGFFRLLPQAIRVAIDRSTMRASVAQWLRSRIAEIKVTTSRSVLIAEHAGKQMHLGLDDGSRRTVDHVVLGTGFRVDVAKMPFLPAELLSALKCSNGYPNLDARFESTVNGLYFIGATAAHCFGPLTRFVAGTGWVASVLAEAVARRGVVPEPKVTQREAV
jgi:thioredoxin reductase